MRPMLAYNAQDLGRAVRELRHDRRWSQADLAEWLGVSRPTVINLEAGRNVSIGVALRAIALLGGKTTVEPKRRPGTTRSGDGR
jgi:DNA-binding XRE family transcriptional regulator